MSNEKLKVFNIGIKYSFDVLKGVFAKKIDYSDSVICYDHIIIARTLEEAKEKYLNKYKFSEKLFPGLLVCYDSPFKVTDMELTNLETKHITFDNLRKNVNYNDFIRYINQELNLDNRISETIKEGK